VGARLHFQREWPECANFRFLCHTPTLWQMILKKPIKTRMAESIRQPGLGAEEGPVFGFRLPDAGGVCLDGDGTTTEQWVALCGDLTDKGDSKPKSKANGGTQDKSANIHRGETIRKAGPWKNPATRTRAVWNPKTRACKAISDSFLWILRTRGNSKEVFPAVEVLTFDRSAGCHGASRP
jgi:hypothetical protein